MAKTIKVATKPRLCDKFIVFARRALIGIAGVVCVTLIAIGYVTVLKWRLTLITGDAIVLAFLSTIGIFVLIFVGWVMWPEDSEVR